MAGLKSQEKAIETQMTRITKGMITTTKKVHRATTREEVHSLRSLVRAFAWYVADLTGQMRQHGIEPPAPPPRVDEYNRTGV